MSYGCCKSSCKANKGRVGRTVGPKGGIYTSSYGVCSTICSNHGLLKILAEDSKLKPKISFLNKIKAVFILSVWHKRQENVSSVLHRAGTTDAPKRKGMYIRRETKVCH